MVFWNFILDVLGNGVSLFIAPVYYPEMLWVIVPIYLSWLFTEIYQEKKGTSLGNAISNGVVALWVGVDWARQLVSLLNERIFHINADFIIKIGLSIAVFAYGLIIILLGIKTKKSVQIFGKIRVVTYLLIVFTPIIYGIIDINWMVMLSIVVFLPIFYYFVELIDWIIPDPKAMLVDEEKTSEENDLFGMNKEPVMPRQTFIQQPQQFRPPQGGPQQYRQYPPYNPPMQPRRNPPKQFRNNRY